jgi:hypothetical protein
MVGIMFQPFYSLVELMTYISFHHIEYDIIYILKRKKS